MTHPYVGTYHDEADEPVCHDVFDKWEQVEGLETIEELREAITREIEEYRAEVRNVIIESDEDEDEEPEREQEEYDEMMEGDTQETITGPSPSKDGTPSFPFPRTASLSPTISQKDLGHGVSPRTAMSQLPGISRTRSRGRGTSSTPQSPALEESGSGSNMGAPISRTSSRRTSGYSMQGRRPASFLFSPFGNGMTPLPSNNGGGAGGGGVNIPSNLNAIASSAESSAGGPGHTQGQGHGHGHGHSASLEFYNGRRSRAPSSTGEFSLRPLIRQLSTVGIGVGGDDGVPIPGAESSRHGLGLDGLPPPAVGSTATAETHPGGDDGGIGVGVSGGDTRRTGLPDRGSPPMKVSPSDAPPTTVRSYSPPSRGRMSKKGNQRLTG